MTAAPYGTALKPGAPEPQVRRRWRSALRSGVALLLGLSCVGVVTAASPVRCAVGSHSVRLGRWNRSEDFLRTPRDGVRFGYVSNPCGVGGGHSLLVGWGCGYYEIAWR
jgi:hypothetical protein